jgi:hypothetical protein
VFYARTTENENNDNRNIAFEQGYDLHIPHA